MCAYRVCSSDRQVGYVAVLPAGYVPTCMQRHDRASVLPELISERVTADGKLFVATESSVALLLHAVLEKDRL